MLLSSSGAHGAASDFLEDVSGGFYELAGLSAEDYAQAAVLIKRYEAGWSVSAGNPVPSTSPMR